MAKRAILWALLLALAFPTAAPAAVPLPASEAAEESQEPLAPIELTSDDAEIRARLAQVFRAIDGLESVRIAVEGGVVTLAACAQTGPTNAAAEQAQLPCMYLARDAGLKVSEYTAVESLAASHQVRMKVEDRVGRRVNASCEVAGGKARWLEALPAGLARV